MGIRGVMGGFGTLPPGMVLPVEGDLGTPAVVDELLLGLPGVAVTRGKPALGEIEEGGSVVEPVGVAETLGVTEAVGVPVGDTVLQSGVVITLVSSVTAPIMARTRP